MSCFLCDYLAPFAGWILLISLSYRLLRFLWTMFRPGINPAKWGAKEGAWAVVTGAAAGIGSGFAQELASKGFNLLLIDRDEASLTELTSKITSGVTVSTLVVDFSTPREIWEPEVRAKLDPLDIGLLVNNVGVNTRFPDEHVVHTDAEVALMLDININTTVAMTRLVLPRLLHKHRGAIINLSSYTATYPCPYQAIYGATKAFIDNYSMCLYQEVRGSGVDVLSVRPYYVMSNMTKFRKTSLTVISPRRLAHDAMRFLGRTPRCQPYWVHQIIEFAMSLLPIRFILSIHHRTMKNTQIKLKRLAERDPKRFSS